MLTRVQIKADGDTAHDVEAEMADAMRRCAGALGFDATITDQVIEGTPGKGFRGRLAFSLNEQPTFSDVVTAYADGSRSPV